jgi:ribonuclease HI
MEEVLELWLENHEVRKKFHSLPVIVLWAFWLARNTTIFNVVTWTPVQIYYKILSTYEHLRWTKAKPHRSVSLLPPDLDFPRGFFNEASTDNPENSGAGGRFMLGRDKDISFRYGTGLGTKNEAEIKAALILMTLAIENRMEALSIYGDSKLVISWLKGEYQANNIFLKAKIDRAKEIAQSFPRIQLNHIFRENNKDEDLEGKEATKPKAGSLQVCLFQTDQDPVLENRRALRAERSFILYAHCGLICNRFVNQSYMLKPVIETTKDAALLIDIALPCLQKE